MPILGDTAQMEAQLEDDVLNQPKLLNSRFAGGLASEEDIRVQLKHAALAFNAVYGEFHRLVGMH